MEVEYVCEFFTHAKVNVVVPTVLNAPECEPETVLEEKMLGLLVRLQELTSTAFHVSVVLPPTVIVDGFTSTDILGIAPVVVLVFEPVTVIPMDCIAPRFCTPTAVQTMV